MPGRWFQLTDRFGCSISASYMQITFKASCEVFNAEHNQRFPDDQKDFVTNPDLLFSRWIFQTTHDWSTRPRYRLPSVVRSDLIGHVSQSLDLEPWFSDPQGALLPFPEARQPRRD